MLNRWIVLFCLPIFFLNAVPLEENFDKVSTGPAPAWVKSCSFDREALPFEGSDINIQFLLEDRQTHWEEQTRYFHKAIKILSQAGAHDLTQLSFDFDPASQRVVVHDIRVIRNGEIINCLEKSHYKILQRENSLEKNIYDGELSLVYFLSDIRKGDILEYSCSFIGLNPYLASHCDEWVRLKLSNNSVNQVYHRLLISSEHPLQIKSGDPELTPKVTELSPDLREWVWESFRSSKTSIDPGMPRWHGLFNGSVQVSQFKSWNEVALKEIPYYVFPEDVEKNPSPEMFALVQKWTESTKDVHERALLALRFVQDEIKYMGFHDGMGGVQPTDPRIVLERRFGDCKDKSVLLHFFLKLMQIDSTPVLVNTKIGKKLTELLPTAVFDHVILRIEIEGSHYWVDSTLTFQGGSLQTTYCPDYHWGLVISPDTKELTSIPSPVLTKPVEIHTSIKLLSSDEAEIKIERTCRESRAERVRNMLQQIGPKKFSEFWLENTQKEYKGASIVSPMSVLDDREQNVIKSSEIYKISTRARAGKKLLKASSFVLEDYLDKEINLERSSPFALEYPIWVKEHIHIENPFGEWAPDAEEAQFENEAIKYVYEMKKEGHTADFHFELKHLQDHVPVSLIQDYWNIVQEIEPNPSLEVVTTAPNSKS